MELKDIEHFAITYQKSEVSPQVLHVFTSLAWAVSSPASTSLTCLSSITFMGNKSTVGKFSFT
jgi:hypothetical protein